MLSKLSNLNSNLALTLGYLNPALNNSAQGFFLWKWEGMPWGRGWASLFRTSLQRARIELYRFSVPLPVDLFCRGGVGRAVHTWLLGSSPLEYTVVFIFILWSCNYFNEEKSLATFISRLWETVVYSQPSLIRTPKGQNQVSALQWCPYYRVKECMVFGISGTKRTVRNREVSVL